MNKLKKFVALALVLCMVLTLMPLRASAATEDFLRVYHVDCGRKFFEIADIEELIDLLSENGYTHLELALGNDGLRLILDDMSVLGYSSDAVTAGIKAGNKAYSHSGEWTEDEMDDILDYAASKSIEIIPLINTPGHMDAILDAMESVGISGAYNGSARTVDVTNAKAVEFTQALVSKYVDYFADKGCTYFNMGADEYANDIYTSGSMGFGHLQTAGLYDEFADYVNGVAAIIKAAGMTPIAFNDGLYFNNNSTAFDTNIVAAYWTSGWGSYKVASAATLAAKGHKILNTNDGWYYVLGCASGTYGYSGASSAVVNTPVTDVPGSNDPAVLGAMACLWCDEPNVSYASYESNVHGLVETLADNNADYFVTASAEEEVPEVTAPAEKAPAANSEEKSITVSVGGTVTDTITGGEYAADKTELDESIATVSVTTTPAQEASVKYTQVSVTCNDLISSNGTQVATGYYHKVGENYYPVYASRERYSSMSNRYNYTWYYSTDDGNSFVEIGEQTYVRTSATPNITVYSASGTEAVEASTTVTFKGVTEGTTYVQVGGVHYTINVVDQAPSNALTASSVTLEYWITNLRVTCNNATSATISTSTDGVNTEEGVDLTTIAGASGTWDWGNVVYWKAVRLDAANEQTTGAGDDETADGTVMTHVRYHGGAWQYKTTDGIWHYFLSTDQLVAYYLQPTTVTDQITTLTKDWGYNPSENTDDGSGKGQVALSFAVVDAGTLTPAEEDIFETSTVIYNYTANRDIGVVAPVSNENYEVYKITVVEGERGSGTSNNWRTGDPVWEKTTNDLGTGEWFDEREVWNFSEGTDPMVNGQLDNIVWPAKNTAFLILFYVRATNANLTVKYVDDSLGGATITERGVFADQGENFYNMENTALPTADGEIFTLSDNATLTYYNYETEKNVVQTFEKSLLNFQDIQPQYRSGAYKYVGSELADDGKTLILHYNIDETVLDPRYVVDFGLSVSVELSNVIKNYGTSDVKSVQMMNAAYGDAVIENGVLTYTPNAILQSPAAVTLKVTNSNDTITIFNVGFIPASTMYYEEGFAAYTGSWTSGSTGSGEQGLQASADADGNYGFDAKYAAETGMSNGTEAVSAASGDKAELAFTGTGIDVYANSDTDTSIMMAMLYRADGSMVKMYQVDTKAKDGLTAATNGQAAESFGLPVISIQGLTHGSYRLVLQHTKPAASDATLRIDGFRVYNTLTAAAYDKDYAEEEKNASFLELRNAVLAGYDITEASASDSYNWAGTLLEQVYSQEGTLEGALVLNGNAAVDAADLLNNGPKNELFLRKGESVTFELAAGVKAQIGLKAVNGSVSYTVNSTTGTVTTSADLFYCENTTGKVTIVNNGDGILSVTKLKLFGAASAAEALVPVSEELVIHALQTMGIIEKPEVVNPFADVAEGSFYYDAVLWAVENGITTGADATHFLPEALCQRASVVTFLWRANGCPEPETTVNPFVDVTEDAFFYKAVLWALEEGITNGVDATHFAPFGSCSRAQVVTFLWRAKGCPAAETANPFADVAEGQWYTDAVLWAVANGVTNGMSDTAFGVDTPCNRAQIVTFLYRADSVK